MIRSLLHSLVRFLFAVLARVHVTGLEHIPRQGPGILAANHLSRLDSPLIFCLVERSDLTALVADTYQKFWIIRWLVSAVNGIWINREQADLKALRAASNLLEQGGLLGIAPEGTRSKTGGLMQAKTGVAYLAERSRVPVIPVAIWGSEKAVSQLRRLRRPELHIRFGEPFLLPALGRGERSLGLQRNTDEIMRRIAEMLPPAYRGVYADKPVEDEPNAG